MVRVARLQSRDHFDDAHSPASLVREHIQRVERSAAFARADRLRAFLRFVVEKALAGEQDAIKAYTIAVEVCGRASLRKPDSIVRVDANRLRARLEAYYRFEGQGDRVRIQRRKGM